MVQMPIRREPRCLVAQDATRPGFLLALATSLPTGTVSQLRIMSGFRRVVYSALLITIRLRMAAAQRYRPNPRPASPCGDAHVNARRGRSSGASQYGGRAIGASGCSGASMSLAAVRLPACGAAACRAGRGAATGMPALGEAGGPGLSPDGARPRRPHPARNIAGQKGIGARRRRHWGRGGGRATLARQTVSACLQKTPQVRGPAALPTVIPRPKRHSAVLGDHRLGEEQPGDHGGS
jgi:hypothetical protein